MTLWIVIAILALALRRRIGYAIFFVIGLAAGAVASILFSILPQERRAA